jgi:LysM repeat protein
MRALRSQKLSRTPGGGVERYLLGIALLLPLVVVVLVLAQLPGASLASPPGSTQADTSMAIMGKRPASTNPAPPPTLVPPTTTPPPEATPALAKPQKAGTYTVRPGDELKQIAADYHVTIWKLISANDIPNPDSLKIGQELHIPPE